MPDFGALLQAAALPRPVARSTRSSRSSASSSFAHVRTSDADSGESLAGSIGSRGGATRLRLIRTDEEAFVSKCRHAIGNRGQDQNQVPTKLCLKSKVETREDCGTEHRGELHVLEPNSLYISAGPNKLYSRPHLACSFLQEDFIQNLLEQSKEMSVWNALFTDISNAVQDEGTDHTLSADTFERWQTGLSKPLQTPARIRTRAITSPSAGSVLTEDADDEMGNMPPTPGLKQILEERLEEVESQIKEVIASSYTRKGLTGPADLAKDMLTKTMKFLKLILNEISRVNRNLTSRSGYSLMEAWCLVTQTFRGIFVYIGKARTAIRSLSPKDPPALNTARVLHVMLRTHDLMDEFVQAEIKNHPIVSSEYVKFLATHSGRREIAEVRTEVKNLSTMCSANQSMLAKLKKKD